MLMISVASQSGARILFYALFVAPFCYAAATVFVLPIFWFVPRARQPSLVVGAIWGGLAAWLAALVVSPSLREWLRWEVFSGFVFAGGAAGISYAYLARSLGASPSRVRK